MNGIGSTLKPVSINSGSSAITARYTRAGQRDARQNRVDVLGRPLARPDARHEPAVLPHVLRHVIRIEDDRGVEVREEDDHRHVQQVVERIPHAELRDRRGRRRRWPGTSA